MLALLACAASACGQGDSGNVMMSSGNMLSPEQVDAALGPEMGNGTGNALESPEPGEAAEPQQAEETADTQPTSSRAEAEPGEVGPVVEEVQASTDDTED